MIIDNKTFPMFNFLESGHMLNCSHSLSPVDVVFDEMLKRFTTSSPFTKFEKNNRKLIDTCLKKARENCLYLTKSQMDEIKESFENYNNRFECYTTQKQAYRGGESANIVGSLALMYHEKGVPCADITYTDSEQSIYLSYYKKYLVSAIVCSDTDTLDCWMTNNEEFDIDKIKSIAMSTYCNVIGVTDKIKEITSWGIDLKPKTKMRLNNEITPYTNNTNYTITIL